MLIKNPKENFPTLILIGYILYSTFISVTIAHSIIIIALVALFGLHFHLSHQQTLKYKQEALDSLKNEMEQKLAIMEKRQSKLEDEVAKAQLSLAGAKNAPEKPAPRKVSW